MMDKESFDALCDALDDAGFEPRKYSGRAMFGRECLSVHCDGGADAAFAICSGILGSADDLDSAKDLIDALSDPSQDSMGRGAVLYWSSIPWLGDEPSSEDDGVEVCDEEYRSEHGKSPRGHGNRAFLTDAEEVFWVTGEYPEARRQAVQKAQAAGLDTLYVGP